MELGNHISIPGIRGAASLGSDIPAATVNRRVNVYLVPETLSDDRYFISIQESGATKIVPPCKGKDALLLVDFTQTPEGEVTENFIHQEVQNA